MGAGDRILVSACLMGAAVRYDGRAKPLDHPLLARWLEEGRLVPFCPECSAGMPVPRPPAEIAAASGADVLRQSAQVFEAGGRDVTDLFLRAAQNALAEAQRSGCRFALLIDGSPSCGSTRIYDGQFAGLRRSGEGVTAALLRRHGIEVFADHQIDILARQIDRLARQIDGEPGAGDGAEGLSGLPS
ncbi:DUF523 domain-containing protein [Rhizobium sp. CC-YZS058]|uniref:DUF523 domain-containing protein n=1 Tax=Rhizobium sp. CC-YZS058 TaxID=3042153 RepID=UPI002B055CAC|nr:DUF523 domain-containing protein [Rhizobium sp. CC-YZS058]MEA3535741.1 DUF523 domain-containing protein [Rhizobium sp. CC-YZS058]